MAEKRDDSKIPAGPRTTRNYAEVIQAELDADPLQKARVELEMEIARKETLGYDLLQLAKWINSRDPKWQLAPQAYAQFIVDVLRTHNIPGSKEIVIGAK